VPTSAFSASGADPKNLCRFDWIGKSEEICSRGLRLG
jgi:hypothetical protein